MQPEKLTLQYAEELDSEDPLEVFRNRFYIEPDVIYLDGNSLGLLSKDAELAVMNALGDWKKLGVEGWNHASPPWFELPERIGALTAPLVGADPHEIVATGTTMVNLHTLLATFYRPSGNRTKILVDLDNFPSDLYAVHSHIRLHGRPETDLVFVSAGAGGWIDESDVISLMTEEVSVVLLPAVWYKTGQLADIPRLTKAAHDKGILIGFDCCHSIGIVPHQLHDWDVDFAVWCNYKYLNGGPGATAGLYVHERHHERDPGLAGWFGSHKGHQFDMSFPMIPAHNAGQWQISTPPILSTVAVGASLEMVKEAGLANIRAKSLRQTTFLWQLLEQEIIDEGLGGQIVTPREENRRGGHIAYDHPKAVQIAKALRANGVIPDFRPPGILRLAPIPLYTSFKEIYLAVNLLRDIIANRTYESFSGERDVVS